MEKRAFGRTGFEATILGFGGYTISEVGEKQALETVETALDEGVNYVDTASTYGPHKSEAYLGKVLPGRKRDSFFLATKAMQRSRAAAEKELGESLDHLKVDVDLLQLHGVNSMAELDAVTGKGGSLEAAIAAKEAGKARFIGITGHTRSEVIQCALDRYPFDSVMLPLGAADRHFRSFEAVIPKARERGAAVVGMKVLAGGQAIGKVGVTGLFEYTWNLAVSTAIVGMRSREEVLTAVSAARAFAPISPARVDEILNEARPLGDASTLWWKRV